MKDKFLSKAVPRGTRTIWRYLSALIILFSLSIGQMWAAEETITWDGTSLTGVSSTNITAGTALAVAGSDGRKVQTIEVYNSAQIASGGTTRKKYNDGWWENFYSTPCTTSGCTDASTTARIEIPFTIGASKTFEITNVSFDFAQNGGSGPAVHAFLVQGTTEEWLGYKSTSGTCNYTPTDVTFESGEAKLVFVLGIGANKLGDNRGFLFSNISITGDVEDSGAGPVAVTAITIAPSSATIKVGKKVTLVPTITPSNATDKAVTWAVTSGSSYASVTNAGVVTGLAVGTAVVTATAHDGSGVTQTATITVEACPTSGTIYKFQLKTDLTNGNLTTSVPQDVVMTTENYLSNLTGGTLTAAARSNVNRINISNGNAIGFANGADAFLKMDLDCAIQEGDILKYTITSNDMILMAGSETEATNRMTLSRNVAQVEVDSKLVGADALYMKRSSSSPKISYFEVFRPVYNTITLEYADGVTPDGTIKVLDGEAATKPADPTWEHHRFDGWYNGEDAYDWSATVEGDLTLTAHWTQLYTVTYAAGDGTATGDAPTQADLAAGAKFIVAANTFAVEGKDFSTWNDGANNFDPGMEYTIGSANVTLTAQWITAVDKYTVHYMDEDGTTPLGADELVAVGQKPAGIPATKPLFAFAAWQLSGSDIALDDASWTSVAANAEVTLTARWTKAYAETIDLAAEAASSEPTAINDFFASKNYASTIGTGGGYDTNASGYLGYKFKNNGDKIQFNLMNGKIAEIAFMYIETSFTISVDGVEAEVVANKSTSATPLVKYVYADGADKLVELVNNSANGKTSVINKIVIRDPFTVTFDADGGDDVASLNGTPSVILPSATKGNDSFVGWFDGENKIGEAGESFTPTADITLKAHWETISTDARLASITFSSAAGTLSPAFDPEVVNYTYTMPYGTAAIPTITGATSVSAKAKTPVIDAQAANWGDVAHIHGVAESDDTKDYYITMKIAPKDGVSIIKVATTGGTNKTVTGLYAGDGDVNLSSNTKMDNGKYIGFTLDGTTLQAGDQINVHTTQAANTSGSHIIFYDNMTDKNELYETGEIGGTGDNIFEINAAMIGATTAYVYRSNADAAHQWNGYVDFIEVTRAMNPVLTAIQFNSTDVAVTGTTVSALLPNGTNLGTMTVTPTIVWNGPGTAAVTGSWAWGANTYVVTDKDGDATTYTITLTEDVLKHTVSFNTHGGSAVASVEVEDGEKLAAAPADPEKDDYIFQGWAETADGAIVDVTSFTISADKEFHAVWAAETGVIKLLDGEGNVNTTDFITGVTAGTVNFDDEDHNCASFGSTGGDIIGKDGAGKFIVYNSKTTQTKIKFVLYNTNSSPKQITLQKLVEGADDTEDVVIDVPSQERFETPYYTFNNTANRTMYAWTNSTSVKVLQVKVVDDGTPVKQAGEVGYSLNLNLGRVFAPANMAVEYDGLAFEASSNYKVLNSTELQTKKNISFTVASPVTLVLESTGAKYQVSTDAAGSGDEYAAGTNEHDLTAGTWHIVPTTTSNMKFASISFTAPKCEKPAIVDMSDVDLCENDPYTALTVSASVSDGGTLHYAWFKEAGATDEPVGTDAASFTPDADGEYYVIVTNQKDGFADNTETSNVVTVQHLAGTTITTAPVSVRKDAGEAATLTVVAAGKNLAYEWFTCNADGTGAVAVDPAATEASLDVIVPDGEQYYKVVVTGDCGTVEAIAKVEKWVELTQQDVTATTFWDFSKNGVSANTTIPVTEEDPVKLLANIPGVNNNELFRSDNIVAGSGKLTTGYIQTQKLSFHATVPGYITVSFSNTGNKENYRYLVVNGVETSAGSKNGTVISYSCAVPAGDVELTVTEADGGKMFNFRSLKFEKMDYFREIRPGYYGTICLEHGGKMYGAALYEVAYFDGADKIFFDEIVDGTMVPGMPYIFLPEGDGKALAVAYSEEAPVAVALSKNGLYGSYEKAELDPDDGNYILLNNQYVFVNTTNVFVGANRAYIRLEEIGTTPFAPAPGRRRISMGVSGESQAQGFENLDASEKPMKVMIDGQMYILRGEKVFDATGRLVK